MQKTTIKVGTFEVNCTILSWGDKVWIVDPGSEATRIAALLVKAGLTPEAILLTHAHFDHIGAVPGLQQRWPQLPVYVHKGDDMVLTHPLNSFPPDYPPIARAAIEEMARRTGPYRLGEDGMLRSGVLIRHLVLPGQISNTRAVLRWVGETFAPGEVLFSLMAPSARSNAMSSKGCTILPRPNQPRSPPRLAVPSIDSANANFSNSAPALRRA